MIPVDVLAHRLSINRPSSVTGRDSYEQRLGSLDRTIFIQSSAE